MKCQNYGSVRVSLRDLRYVNIMLVCYEASVDLSVTKLSEIVVCDAAKTIIVYTYYT